MARNRLNSEKFSAGFFEEVRSDRQFVGVVEIVQRSVVWRVWLEHHHVQDEGAVRILLFANEVGGVVTEEGGHGVFFRQVAALGLRERLVALVIAFRCVALRLQELEVVRFPETVFLIVVVGVVVIVAVLDRQPSLEAVLRRQVVAKVPLAEVGAEVVVGDHLGDGLHVRRQVAVGTVRVGVLDHAGRVRVEAGHDAGAGGGANRLGDVRVFEDKAA